MTELSEVFWQFFVVAVIGLLGAVIRAIYTSKCTRFTCCGMQIERNIEAEVREDMQPRGGPRGEENL